MDRTQLNVYDDRIVIRGGHYVVVQSLSALDENGEPATVLIMREYVPTVIDTRISTPAARPVRTTPRRRLLS